MQGKVPRISRFEATLPHNLSHAEIASMVDGLKLCIKAACAM
mgnify:CR=1 FL=1